MKKQNTKELARILANIKDKEEMASFLDDLLTPAEKQEIPKRLQVVKMLLQGVPQRQISEKLGVGIATVTRGSKELKNKTGGFRKILQKFYDKK